MAQPYQEVLEIADVIIDLSREQPSVIHRLPDRRGLNVLPLDPQSNANKGYEWNNGSKHQPQ
jgi:hypothetical protein